MSKFISRGLLEEAQASFVDANNLTTAAHNWYCGWANGEPKLRENACNTRVQPEWDQVKENFPHSTLSLGMNFIWFIIWINFNHIFSFFSFCFLFASTVVCFCALSLRRSGARVDLTRSSARETVCWNCNRVSSELLLHFLSSTSLRPCCVECSSEEERRREAGEIKLQRYA